MKDKEDEITKEFDVGIIAKPVVAIHLLEQAIQMVKDSAWILRDYGYDWPAVDAYRLAIELENLKDGVK